MRIYSIFCMAFLAIFLNGCFLTSLFNFGPKIDLAKSSSWKITSFNLDGTLYEPKDYDEIPHLRFDTKELRLNGNTGCNMFFASYAWLDDKNIEVRNSGMTRKMCHPESAMKFEQKLMEEFEGDFEVIQEDKLIILKRENLQITLTPINPSDQSNKKSEKSSQESQENQTSNEENQIDQSQEQSTPDSQTSTSNDEELQSSLSISHHLADFASNPLSKSNPLYSLKSKSIA